MSKRSRANSIAECYVCSKRRPCEREHVWPERFGGKSTAPICVSCHDAIDRMCIDTLGADEVMLGYRELKDEFGLDWLKNGYELGKKPNHRATALRMFQDLLNSWDGFTPEPRIVGMKIVRVLVEMHGEWTEAEPAFIAEFCSLTEPRATRSEQELPI